MNQSFVRGSSFSLTSRFTSATASVMILVMVIKSVRQVVKSPGPGGGEAGAAGACRAVVSGL